MDTNHAAQTPNNTDSGTEHLRLQQLIDTVIAAAAQSTFMGAEHFTQTRQRAIEQMLAGNTERATVIEAIVREVKDAQVVSSAGTNALVLTEAALREILDKHLPLATPEAVGPQKQTNQAGREPLEPGTVIEFGGQRATVIRDSGKDTLEVDVDGDSAVWAWIFEGQRCRVLSRPSKRKPLRSGTLIEFMGAQATVVKDEGLDTLVVECEGVQQQWDWTLDGTSCTVVKDSTTA